MRFAYADPPYPGKSAKHYGDHPDFAGEVDHAELIERLETFDGWLLHTNSTALRELLPLTPEGVRVMAWVKPFAVFKRNVSPAYAWEPILVKPLRKAEPNRIDGMVMRDWLSENIVLNKGEFAGAKPERLCCWLFEVSGLNPDDDFFDLYPGTGAVARAWEIWSRQLSLVEPG